MRVGPAMSMYAPDVGACIVSPSLAVAATRPARSYSTAVPGHLATVMLRPSVVIWHSALVSTRFSSADRPVFTDISFDGEEISHSSPVCTV